MEFRTINSIERLQNIFQTPQTPAKSETESLSFAGVFENAINNLQETDYASVNNSELLATGDVDDLHSITIADEKAALAVSLLVQLRNRALESYNQLMQIQV